jgi:hypothetical protein
VDADALLSDGRIFSYKYYYGSCSGCDDWEDRGLTTEQITQEMIEGGTYFNNLEEYNSWISLKDK